MKGAVSQPMIIVMALIIAAILIALAVIWITGVSSGSQDIWKDTSGKIRAWICSSLPLVGGFLCG